MPMETRRTDLGRGGPSPRRYLLQQLPPRAPSGEDRAAQELLPHSRSPCPLPQRGRGRAGEARRPRKSWRSADGDPCRPTAPCTFTHRAHPCAHPCGHTAPRTLTRQAPPGTASAQTHSRCTHSNGDPRMTPHSAHPCMPTHTPAAAAGEGSVPAWLCGTAS